MHLLRLPEVIELTRLSKPSVYRLIAQAGFPKPLRIGPRASRWYRHEIVAWIEGRPRGGSDKLGDVA